MSSYSDFRKDLAKLINRHSMEGASNTPDFILAEYLTNCLASFDAATRGSLNWHSREDKEKQE